MSARMTEDRLREIEARADAASPGPWAYDGVSRDDNAWCLGLTDPPICGEMPVEVDGAQPPIIVDFVAESGTSPSFADADFIAHSRTDVPDLVAEVRRLQQEVELERGALRVGSLDMQRVLKRNEGLRAALEWFADEGHYQGTYRHGAGFADAVGLSRARAALLGMDPDDDAVDAAWKKREVSK